jgi:hypothetical protein
LKNNSEYDQLRQPHASTIETDRVSQNEDSLNLADDARDQSSPSSSSSSSTVPILMVEVVDDINESFSHDKDGGTPTNQLSEEDMISF